MAFDFCYIALDGDKLVSVIASVEDHRGREINVLDIDLWLSEHKAHKIEYVEASEFYERFGQEVHHGNVPNMPS